MWDQFSGLVWPFAFLIFAVFAFGMVRRLGASTGARPEPSYDAQPALVSRAELAAFNTLRDAIGTSAHICPKVRIADVLKVRRTGNARADLIAFNRIAQKHVDFVLTDAAGVILCAIEVDDRSHDRADRRRRDGFVDAAFGGANVPLIRVKPGKLGKSEPLQAILKTLHAPLADTVAGGIPVPR